MLRPSTKASDEALSTATASAFFNPPNGAPGTSSMTAPSGMRRKILTESVSNTKQSVPSSLALPVVSVFVHKC